MRYRALLAATAIFIEANGSVEAGAISPFTRSQIGSLSLVELVQEKRKPETITQRVKRAWKELVGYKFDVACPILIPISHSSCTEAGKDRGDARAKCVSRYPFCYITKARR